MVRRLALLALPLLAACGQNDGPDVKLSNAWARPTIGQAPGSVYLTIDNEGDSPDRLTGAFTDQAAMAMIHQNEVVNGVARMRMAGEINVPANDRIEMRPGGTHVMLQGLRAPLKEGEDIDLVLKFRHSKDQTVTVTVRPPDTE